MEIESWIWIRILTVCHAKLSVLGIIYSMHPWKSPCYSRNGQSVLSTSSIFHLMPGFSDDCLSLGYTRTSCESHPLQDVTNYLVLSSAEPFTWVSSVSSCDSRYFSPQGCVFLCVSNACHNHWVYSLYCVRIYMQLSWLLREDVLVISLIKNTVACSVMGSKRVLNDSHIHIPWYLLGTSKITLVHTMLLFGNLFDSEAWTLFKNIVAVPYNNSKWGLWLSSSKEKKK